MILDLDLAGQAWQVTVSDAQLDGFYRPLLAELRARAEAAAEPRYVVFVAAPPGAGKTTLCAILQALAAPAGGPVVQPLPMDGYHLPNAILDATPIEVDGETMPLRRLKGCPDSYDLAGLRRDVAALRAGLPLRWPRYDRVLHDPVPRAMGVCDRGICLVEGTFLLLDRPGWRDLRPLAHWSWFLDVDEALIVEPILQRHIRGGRSPDDARRHYQFCDRRNRDLIYRCRLPADLLLRAGADRTFSRHPA